MKHPEKVLQFSRETYRKCYEYIKTNREIDQNESKVCFMGLSLHPNKGGLWNFDILSLYKYFCDDPNLEVRIHDPHIRGTEALRYEVWLGRQSENDNWSHSYDVIVLSTPHLFYLSNLRKLSIMFKPERRCLFLDLFGGLTRVVGIGDYIDYVNFVETTKRWGISGGFETLKLK